MSFDLGFWWEAQPVSSAEAGQKYLAMVEGGTGIVHERSALATFYNELTSQFPDLSEENMDTSPWASSLYRTDECVIVSISYPRKLEMSSFLFGLASRCGITCYDPQESRVHFPEGGNAASLELADGSIVDSPSRDDVARALNGLSLEDWYVIVELEPGWFIQVGFGVAAGVPEGFYALEVREGAKEKHFRAVVGELARVIDAFYRFIAGDSSWQAGLQFSPVSY
ncbi:hypothetical protein [Kitasatospora fiedleri]|uniref:hypothetical protein n=1 Tax=Kitasatospora fiedleri TaxID=2991545 RepID=UPI00249C3B5A|nr:hypothetical protein [Kitasatospora fiedleri]